MTSVARQRVVVTGLGATSPLGPDIPSTWDGALNGANGVRPLPEGWVERFDLPVHFACCLATPTAELLPKHVVKKLDPNAQMAVLAGREAWADAGSPQIDPERLGVAVSTGIGGIHTLLDSYDTLLQRGARRVLPMTVPKLIPNSPAGQLAIEFNAKAGAHSPVSACASGAEAMGYARAMIQAGQADIVIAGAAEAAIHPLTVAGFAAMQALSTRNDSPETASRPYDVDRDGFVMGEGAGILVLESEEHALARGATIYAELAGMGSTSDAHHIAAPDPEGAGAASAMQQALACAGARPDEVVHLNAHATATPVGDIAESRAAREVLGAAADHVAVSATKSMTGHLLGAAGALEGVLSVLALHHNEAPPTINLHTMDPAIARSARGSP